MSNNVVQLEMPKGYRIVCDVAIDNAVFFRINSPETEFLRIGDIKYILRSSEKGKNINESNRLRFEVGDFNTHEEAKEEFHNIVATISYNLSFNGCSCTLRPRIKDLSVAEFMIDASYHAAIQKTLCWGNQITLDSKKKANALNLLQRAEQVQGTALAFMFYVIVLESLLDDEANSPKTGQIIDLIDCTQAYITGCEATEEDKRILISNLDNLRTLGSRNAVKKMISDLCGNKTCVVNGKEMKYTSIYNKCYDRRNQFAHKGIFAEDLTQYLQPIRQIAYEVVYKNLSGSSDDNVFLRITD